MNLFNTLCLEISAQCNRSCKFCPVAYNDRPDEHMDPSLLTKAAEELAALKYKGRIELYIYNEPVKDKAWLHSCLRLLRDYLPRACLMIATNGDYFKTSDEIYRLYTIGLNQLLINCYSKGLYERRKHWLEELSEDVDRTGSVYSILSSKKRVVQMLDKSNPEEFGTGIFRLINRAGNIPDFIAPLEEPVKRMCVKPFRLLNINWKGEALVCCQDYHGDVSFGNLRSSTLVELWNHPVMNTYRQHLLEHDRSLPLCSACDCHAGAYPHNVPQPGKYAALASEVQALYRRRVQARTAAQGKQAASKGSDR